jgi:microcompartment protein CcmL/EutN
MIKSQTQTNGNGALARVDFNPALRDDIEMGPCIGLLETCSIARGMEVADALLWQAEVELLCATPVHPGKYVILFSGPVDDVRAALRRGEEIAGADLVDRLHIPQVHPQVERALRRRGGKVDVPLDALGVIETTTVASSIVAADLAVKTAIVDLIDLRIANGLGGKSFLVVMGNVADVRSSIAAGARFAQEKGLLAREVVIARPHPDLLRHL